MQSADKTYVIVLGFATANLFQMHHNRYSDIYTFIWINESND